MPPPIVGDVIAGKYELTKLLGKGGMGVVFAAHDRDMDESVAIKFLAPDVQRDVETLARFVREAQAGRRIKNEHVAQVYEVRTVDEVSFIVMEHLDGEDLAAMLIRRGALPVAECVDLVLQACEAINEAHALGIVHRDLKPANLFVTKGADGHPFVKVLDFGISKSMSSSDMGATANTAVLGSPRYMSPEQIASSRSVDARSDVWALGVIGYELLTGQAPFTGDTFPALCASITRGTFPKLRGRRDDIPASVDEAIAECLQVDRDRRLPTVEAFAARLAPFGTDRGRESYTRIARLVASASEGAEERVAAEVAAIPSADRGGATLPPNVTAQSLAKPEEERKSPRKRRGAQFVVGSFGLVALVAGALYWHGKHGAETTTAPEDSAHAATRLDKECTQGVAASCNGLGALYARGEGVKQDFDRALALYTQACKAGSGAGCVNAGEMHFDGEGVRKDEELGFTFFGKGCDADAPAGCRDVSIAYATGRGTPKSLEKAFSFADQACRRGDAPGCVRVANARIAGDGVAKDPKEGVAELDAQCTDKQAVACEQLVADYFSGVGTDILRDPVLARRYAKKGCAIPSQKSCETVKALDGVDFTGSTVARINAANAKKCAGGNLEACGRVEAGLGGKQ